MTAEQKAKDKAKELISKFKPLVSYNDYSEEPVSYEKLNRKIAKQCAKITCDTVLETLQWNETKKKNYWQSIKDAVGKY